MCLARAREVQENGQRGHERAFLPRFCCGDHMARRRVLVLVGWHRSPAERNPGVLAYEAETLCFAIFKRRPDRGRTSRFARHRRSHARILGEFAPHNSREHCRCLPMHNNITTGTGGLGLAHCW